MSVKIINLLLAAAMLGAAPGALAANNDSSLLPTGTQLSPVAAPGAVLTNLSVTLPDGRTLLPGHPQAMQTSPDGNRLYVLTSGFNVRAGADGKLDPAASSEWLFAYDVIGGLPVQAAAAQVPNSFAGLALSADGKTAYVTGGVNDNVMEFALNATAINPVGEPIKLGHKAGLGIDVKPAAGAIVLSPDGAQALVANYFNDSVSLIDLRGRKVLSELDLRPGVIDPSKAGVPGGEYPVDVLWTDTNHAYVLSQRDRELIALSVTGETLAVTGRVSLIGQPARMVADKSRGRIYVALETADTIQAIDQKTLKILASLRVTLPNLPKQAADLLGTGLNSLTVSADNARLYATLGALNAIAIIKLGDDDGDDDELGLVDGMIPTGWYPLASAMTKDGHLHVSHGKSLPGPNVGACRLDLALDSEYATKCNANNKYVLQLEHGGLVSLPMPKPLELKRLSLKVATNNNLTPPKDHGANAAMMRAIASRIKHVIFIVKENRTYDQVLGGIAGADGDPKLALLAPFSPNHIAIATGFVTLDRAFASGEVSNTGWMWTTAARTTDALERISPVNYAKRGLDYASEGMNRYVNTGLGDSITRNKANAQNPLDPNLLPGTNDVSAPDMKLGEAGTQFLWEAVRRAGLTIRNYGFFIDDVVYAPAKPGYLPTSKHPFAEKAIQGYVSRKELVDVTNPYFRGYDQSTPDYWRYLEWQREFDAYEAKGELPNLSLVRFSHDHFGSFKTAEDGVNTVETQMADNDYAVGLLVERIARSRFKDDTLIFSIEDDAQNGADHVDARRTVVLAAGPYVKQGAVISEHYTTVNLLRTITDVLGAEPVGLQAALAEPMAKIFDLKQKAWSYRAIVPDVLRQTQLPLPAENKAMAPQACPTRDAAYWEQAMAGQDFSSEDRLDSTAFNKALEVGLAPLRDAKACKRVVNR